MSFVLQIRCPCKACQKTVFKVVHRFKGVSAAGLDDEGNITVHGRVDPALIIENLKRVGKSVVLLSDDGQYDVVQNMEGLQLEEEGPCKGAESSKCGCFMSFFFSMKKNKKKKKIKISNSIQKDADEGVDVGGGSDDSDDNKKGGHASGGEGGSDDRDDNKKDGHDSGGEGRSDDRDDSKKDGQDSGGEGGREDHDNNKKDGHGSGGVDGSDDREDNKKDNHDTATGRKQENRNNNGFVDGRGTGYPPAFEGKPNYGNGGRVAAGIDPYDEARNLVREIFDQQDRYLQERQMMMNIGEGMLSAGYFQGPIATTSENLTGGDPYEQVRQTMQEMLQERERYFYEQQMMSNHGNGHGSSISWQYTPQHYARSNFFSDEDTNCSIM